MIYENVMDVPDNLKVPTIKANMAKMIADEKGEQILADIKEKAKKYVVENAKERDILGVNTYVIKCNKL